MTVTEGNCGTVNATFTRHAVGASGQTVTRRPTARPTARATRRRRLHGAPAATLDVRPGETTQTITVQVTGDLLDELDETFFVNLPGAVSATIADGQGVGTIIDDDDPPAISISDVDGDRGQRGHDRRHLHRHRCRGQRPHGRRSTTRPPTAAPSRRRDYQRRSRHAHLRPRRDHAHCHRARSTATCSTRPTRRSRQPLAARPTRTIADAQAVGTITDDDALPAIADRRRDGHRGRRGHRTAVFTVTLCTRRAASRSPSNYATGERNRGRTGRLHRGQRRRSTFAPGETTKTVTVAVNGDVLDEIDETFT